MLEMDYSHDLDQTPYLDLGLDKEVTENGFTQSKIATKQASKKSEQGALVLYNAQVLIKNREYILAENLIKSQISFFPEYRDLADLLVNVLQMRNKIDEALIVAKALVKKYQDSASFFQLGQIQYTSGAEALAMESFYEGLSILQSDDSLLFNVYKNMGNIFLKQGDTESAEEFYNKAFSIQPTCDVLLVNLGTLYIQTNSWNRALESFKNALQVNSRNDKAYVGLAVAYHQVADYELAWANIAHAIEINPENKTAVQFAINWALSKHQPSRAIEIAQTYLDSNWDKDISLALIQMSCDIKDYQAALVEIQTYLLWEPRSTDVRKIKLEILKLLGKI